MRASIEKVVSRRRERANVILMTGITSFIGSEFAEKLLLRGHNIIFICRERGHLNACQRVDQIFKWLGVKLSREISGNIKVIQGELTHPYLGLDPDTYEYLCENVDEIVHFAADTRFSERRRKEIEDGNITATNEILKLARQGRCYFLHYVSTCYSAGIRSGLCPEEYAGQDRFNNPYEESKNLCEHNVLSLGKEKGIRVNIYRPSIVYGNAKTGRSFRFNALYYPIKMVNYLKEQFERDFADNGGEYSAQMGVSRDLDGVIHTPIRFVTNEGTSLNVVPVNFVVSAILAIMDESVEGNIFHIVSRRQDTISWNTIMQYMEKFLKVRGLQPVTTREYEAVPRNKLETLFDAYINPYKPYFDDSRSFSDEKAQAILEKHGIHCPCMDFNVFERVMRYAKEVEWGKNIFANIKIGDSFEEWKLKVSETNAVV